MANWYVRPSGGTGAGTSWTAAWNGLNGIVWASVAAGDTIWVAGGTYSSTTTPGKSGTSGSRIYLKRVRTTDAVPVAAAGWSASYDSQVIINPGSIGFYWSSSTGSYLTIDGRIDSGIIINYPDAASSSAAVYMDGNPTGVVLQYIDSSGPSRGQSLPYTFIYGVQGFNIRSSTDLTISHCRVHDDTGGIFLVSITGTTIVEYCKVYRIWELYNATLDAIDGVATGTYQQWHEEYLTVRSCYGTVYIRYNEFYEGAAEGILLSAQTSDTPGTALVYGNLMHSSPVTLMRFLAVQRPWTVKAYNNTIVDTWAGFRCENGSSFGAGSEARNNLFINVGTPFLEISGTITISHNATSGTPFIGSSPQTGLTTSIFVNYAGDNYRLSTTTDAGYTLVSPYNTDMDGNTRGYDLSWDRGAYEYTLGGPPSDSVDPEITITNPTSSERWSKQANSIGISGTASDNIGVTSVTWSNNLGGSGTATGTTSWTIPAITLYPGENIITITAWDAAGNGGTDTLTVVYPGTDILYGHAVYIH